MYGIIPFITLLYLISFIAGKAPPNSILSATTVREIFIPALPQSGVTTLDLFLSNHDVPAGNQWSTALALRTEDWPERRKKGSAFCKLNIFSVFHSLMCLCRVRLGWNFRTYRSRDGSCCRFCDTVCTLREWSSSRVVCRIWADFVFQSATIEFRSDLFILIPSIFLLVFDSYQFNDLSLSKLVQHVNPTFGKDMVHFFNRP